MMGWSKRFVGALAISMLGACATAASSGFDENDGGGADDAQSTSADSGGGSSGNPKPAEDSGSDAPIETGPGGNPIGFPCAKPTDCASGQCKAVLAGATSSVCVTTCNAQADCPDTFFCDPSTPGATSGFCVPRSPAHCKTCASNAECGSLSEVCGVAAGDTAKACHVDCAIGGAAACPPDYTCESTLLDGTTAAKVCRPAGGLSCLDSLGGFCDRVATPQTCARKNASGTCVGQRQCLAASTRYSSCGAAAPVCKATCTTNDPAGCTTSYCPEATSGPTNCGACGNVCPGYNTQNSNVTCNQPMCSYSCKGETYDVDANKANGCEVADPTTGNHSTNTAAFVGDRSCKDGQSDPNISGRIPSDAEVHENPGVSGFVAGTGSTPDYYRVHGTGSILCTNQVVMTLQMAGATYPACYHLHIDTNKNSYDCDTNGAGTCTINANGNSQWDDGTDIFFIVSKRNIAGCGAAQRDNPTYTVKGHL